MARWIVFVVLIALGLAQPARADYESALAAYQAGNFDAAAREFQKLAAKGEASAQYYLGLMYADGRGVGRNDVLAMKWLQCATDGRTGAKDAGRWLGRLADAMGADAIARADRLARQCGDDRDRIQQRSVTTGNPAGVERRTNWAEYLFFLPGDFFTVQLVGILREFNLDFVSDFVEGIVHLFGNYYLGILSVLLWALLVKVIASLGEVTVWHPSAVQKSKSRPQDKKRARKRRSTAGNSTEVQ